MLPNIPFCQSDAFFYHNAIVLSVPILFYLAQRNYTVFPQHERLSFLRQQQLEILLTSKYISCYMSAYRVDSKKIISWSVNAESIYCQQMEKWFWSNRQGSAIISLSYFYYLSYFYSCHWLPHQEMFDNLKSRLPINLPIWYKIQYVVRIHSSVYCRSVIQFFIAMRTSPTMNGCYLFHDKFRPKLLYFHLW